MKGFNPSVIIENPDLLFGRNKAGQLLNKVLLTIRRGTNCQIQGEKRSGKTSTLKCLFNKIETNHSELVPIFFDFKETAINDNTIDVFRYIFAKCFFELNRKGFINEKNQICGFSIDKNLSMEDVYDNLSSYSGVRLQSLIKEFILFYTEYFDLGIVFLIDEYEYLLAKALEHPTGFMFLRNLSESSFDRAIKPLTYVIAGSKPWSKLCTEVGSPELNNQGVGIYYTSPLSQECFDEMWRYTLDGVEIRADISDSKKMYLLSGGIPFFAKKIAESVNDFDSEIDYFILQNDYISMMNNLYDDEIFVIFNLVFNKKVVNKGVLKLLEYRGIIKYYGSTWEINGKLFYDFIYQYLLDNPIKTESNDVITVVNKIFSNISYINRTYANLNRELLFELIPDENELRLQMQGNIFSEFASSLYRCVFERTALFDSASKRKVNLKRLPTQFRTTNEFIKIVDSLRHEFGGHLTSSKLFITLPNQFSRADLLTKLKGNSIEPNPDEYLLIQIKVLKMFEKYLTEIINYIKAAPNGTSL